MSDPAALIARLHEQRRRWVDLPGGVRVRIVVPDPFASIPFANMKERGFHDFMLEQACACVDAWDGVTEATVLGPTEGSSETVKFSQELWRVMLRNRLDWLSEVFSAIWTALSEAIAAKDATAKN